jgi:hypothetical protein
VDRPGERRHVKRSMKRINERRNYEIIKEDEKGFFIM